jgi:hypothetical protein
MMKVTWTLVVFPLLSLSARATPPEEGLRGEFFADRSFTTPGAVRFDGPIDFTFDRDPPYKGDKLPQVREGHYEHFSTRWTGRVVPRFSETYTFHVTVDDGALLWVDGRLVLRGWKDQGPTEYTAQVKLTADKPVPVKLLYYNAWFAGSIKLSWSSPSQKKELIPRSRLLPPEPEQVSKVEEKPSLADKVRVATIELPAAVKNDPGGKKPSIILSWLKDEGVLGWNDEKGTMHLTRLGADLKPRGEDALLERLDLRGLVAHDDGSIALLAADLPNRMCVLKVDRKGKELFRTVLVGDKGRGEGGHYLDDHFSFTGRFAASSSGIYAAHFAHSANFGKGGVHQGGFYAVLDGAGKVQHSNTWTVSHSMDQRLLAMRQGGFVTISAGDCYPKGIVFENRELSVSRVLYPEPDKQEKFGNCGGFVNATLGSLVPVKTNASLTFLTKEGEANLLMYLLFDEDGQELKRSKLAEMPATADGVVRHAALGDHLLLAWQQKAGETTLARLHPSGALMSKPTTVKERLPQNDDLVMFPGGDVGWISAKSGGRHLRVIRVHP